MTSITLARQLVDTLPVGQPGLFNPWKEHCEHDTEDNGPDERFDRLESHLNCEPKLLLIGEAPGYQGCRYSGVAFTSERQILDGIIPRLNVGPIPRRMTKRDRPFSEPSATTVWKELYQLGLEDSTVLWNSVMLHPFKPEDVWTNRAPSDVERKLGYQALELLAEHLRGVWVIAVGREATKSLDELGINYKGVVRHPAFGGVPDFRKELHDLVGKAVKRATSPL